MSFDSPLRKKRRRSFFTDRLSCRTNETTTLDAATVAPGSSEVNEYLKKLNKEKEQWKQYKEELKKQYLTLKSLKAAGKTSPVTADVLEHLPEEDKEYLKDLNKTVEQLARFDQVVVKSNEDILLLSKEFEKQLAMEKLMYNNYEICLHKLQKLVCTKDPGNDIEILAPQLAVLNKDSPICDEPFLFIEGV